MSERRKSRAIGVVLLGLGLCLALSSPFSAGARTQDGLKVTGSAPYMKKSYPALTPAPRQGTGTVNWLACAEPSVTFCDIIRFDLDVQGRYKLFTTFIRLSWPNPKTKENPNGNDLTMGIWEIDEHDPTCCRSAWTGDNVDVHPEVVSVGTDEPDPFHVHIIVNAAAGTPNLGYTVEAEIVETDLGALPEGRRPGSRLGGAPTVSGSSSSRGSTSRPSTLFGGPADEGGAIEATPETIKVPGPDGELVDQTLGVLVRGEEAQRRGVSPVVPIVIAIVLLGGATAAFFFIRSRRQGVEETSTSNW